MYVWSENIASRGGQEVGSCLIKHFKNGISNDTKKIILYSDSCGGQNRNIKVTLLLKKFLSENENVQEIEQKFFVSGHSYNSCDRCFSLIEKRKRFVGDVFTPNDWLNVIESSKVSSPKFHITPMQAEDFTSSYDLEKLIVNRKVDVQKGKINWFGFRIIRHEKDELFHINAEENGVSKIINIKKKGIDENIFRQLHMKCLYPDGKEICQKKYEDLMALLKFIPKQHHSFYLDLKHGGVERDFGLASDSEPEYDSDGDEDNDVIFVDSN